MPIRKDPLVKRKTTAQRIASLIVISFLIFPVGLITRVKLTTVQSRADPPETTAVALLPLLMVSNQAAWHWRRLSYTTGSSFSPRIAVNGENIHVVWYDNASGSFEIFYKRSIDNGNTWSQERLLSNNGTLSIVDDIAVSGNDIHVLSSDDVPDSSDTPPGNVEIFYKRSADNGNTWSDRQLTNNQGVSRDAAVAVNGNNIHVVWEDDSPGDSEIFYMRSTDGGHTWSEQQLSDSESEDPRFPEIAVAGHSVHVVWSGYFKGNYEIFYMRSVDNGNTWTSQRLSNSTGDSWNPAVAATADNVHVIWSDDTRSDDIPGGRTEIFYIRSRDNGNTWSEQQLSNNSGWSSAPAVAVNGDSIHVVWYDNTPGNFEIFYMRSSDNGSTWSERRLSYSAGLSEWPAIGVSDKNVHVVWQDNSLDPDAPDIFYIRGPLR